MKLKRKRKKKTNPPSRSLGTSSSILWVRLDHPGHEAARVARSGSSWQLEGVAVFVHDDEPVCFNYTIVCTAKWRTRSVHVKGWIGRRVVDLAIDASEDGTWLMNGHPCPAVADCVDVDLNFSPSTNLLPIRRLSPAIGDRVAVRAAWLRFPSLTLEPLDQTYSRLAADLYRYESAGGSFVADLRVNSAGFVVDYPGIWRAEAVA
jgi:hypothetical protein